MTGEGHNNEMRREGSVRRVRLKIKDLGTTYIPLNAARMPEFVRLNKTPPLVDDEEV